MEENVKEVSKQVVELEEVVKNLKTVLGSFEKTKEQLYSHAQSILDLQNIVIMDRRTLNTLVNKIEQLERKLEKEGMYQ